MEKRQAHLDTVSGLLICYMMLMHILLWKLIPLSNESVWLEPLKFFMFWFFFKSGMFFRLKSSKEVIIGGGRKLLLPFVVFSILGYMLNVLHLLVTHDSNWVHYSLTPIKELVMGGSVGGNDVLWFLTSLFLVQVAYNELIKRSIDSRLIVALALGIAFVCHILSVSKPAYLANASLGIAMYSLGYSLKNVQYNWKVCVLAFVIYITIMVGYPSHIDLRTNTLNEGGSYLLALLFSVAGCIVINCLFKRIPVISLVGYIGRKSMNFYVMHMLVLGLLTMLPWKAWNVSAEIEFSMMCFACLVIPALVGRLLEHSSFCWVLGKVQAKS